MTTCLRKSCLFDLPRVPFVNCCQFMYLVISLLVLRAGWVLIVSVPGHCLSFDFSCQAFWGGDWAGMGDLQQSHVDCNDFWASDF